MQKNVIWVIASFILAICIYNCVGKILSSTEDNGFATDIAKEPDDRLLLFSTLEGQLVAIEPNTGNIRWKTKDKPAVTVPLNTTDAIIPLFLPDPRDGSLYLLGDNHEPLKKLPFNIPQLVSSSPCRSSDGILYTGKKKDTWFMLDPKTGYKRQILGWDNSALTCPIDDFDNFEAIFIGRTQYSVMMVDIKNTQRKWNVTFYDYSANPLSKEMLQNYDLVHFSSTSTGRIVSMDRRRGSLMWDIDLGSPVVAIYILDPRGLLNLPFTSMANHTVAHLAEYLLTHQLPFQNEPSHMKLYPTLYIGEHTYGLYALPSLVDQNMVTITSSEAGPLLLEGPDVPKYPQPYTTYPLNGHNYGIHQGASNVDPLTFYNNYTIIYLGHYNVPDYNFSRLLISGQNNFQTNLITDERSQEKTEKKQSVGTQTESGEKINLFPTTENHNESSLYKGIGVMVQQQFKHLKQWINQQESKGLKLVLIILIGFIIAMFWYLQMQVREFQQLSQNGSRSSQQSSFGRNGAVTALTEELADGMVRVGKIMFHPEQLLGKGCEGTFVYRGKFDERQVAVKRLLPECFTFADREVALLRESDAHPHVIRYFCTEQDRMFRYIALELCQFTLHEYVLGRCDTSLISSLDILRQATSGLAHLHSLDIVHRDIKPHNVLLSMPSSKGEVRAMISDFGLCKKLQVGRVSFSRRSGITGTDGWIAPEILNGNERTTCAVDIFSLGCLFYHVLSEGAHPFGDSLRRQANILGNVVDLEDLKGVPWQIALQKSLLSAMISQKPQDRPPCSAILSHPMFWISSTILGFFQDVSDRIEKAEYDDLVLKTLERSGKYVVRGDWRIHIHEEVAKDLRKYRSYRGESVRDLLRALRNKKHHYRELTTEAQTILGAIPDAFTTYWTTRFPLLLIHTWLSMQIVAPERLFSHYYHTNYRFTLCNYNDPEELLYPIYKEDVNLYYDFDDPEKNLQQIFNLDPNFTLKRISESEQEPNYSRTPKKYEQNYRKYKKHFPTEEVAADANQNYTPERFVGLYRNGNRKVVSSLPTKPQKNSSEGTAKNAADDFVKQRRYNKPKKVLKKNEEPLHWSLNNDNKKTY